MITDKSRYGHDAVLDVNCGDSVQVLRTEPMTLTEQEQAIVQKYLGIALLEKSYIDANGHLMVVLSDGRTLDVGSARGLSGATPYLGENGNWFVEGVDTLQSARGLPGFTPYIGENEHWWIDETDTGIPARGIPLTEKADNTRFLRNDGTWQKVTPENIGAAKQSDFAAQTARIEALEQRTVTAPYYTDDSVAYIKEIPENALPFASVDMVGGMTRKCTNLIPFPYTFGDSETKDGVTFIANSDGSVTCNGTATRSIYIKIADIVALDGNFFISGCPVGGSDETYCIIIDENNTGIARDYGAGAKIYASNGNTYSVVIYFPNGSVVSNVVFKPMLNAGTEPLPYEPYFDGLRSAPVTEVESVGVNLFDVGTSLIGYRCNNDGTIVKIDGYAVSDYIDVKKNTSYYLTNVCGVAYGSAVLFDANKVVVGDKTVAPTGNTVSGVLLVGSNVKYIRVNVFVRDADINTVMVTEGSTALPYTPYRRNTLPIPAEVQALDGYGWGISDKVYNYIDFEKKQFVKRVERVDLGTFTWNGAGDGVAYAVLPKKTNNGNFLLSHVPAGINHYYISIDLNAIVCEFDNSYSITQLPELNSGVEIFYNTAEPVITDISDLLPSDNLIRVESGGTVTMVNEYGYDAPSEITYARLTWQ